MRYDRCTDTLRTRDDRRTHVVRLGFITEGKNMAASQTERKRPRRTFTMDDQAFEQLTRMAEDVDISRSRLLEQLVGQDHEAYERLMQVATSTEVNPGEYLERVVFLERDPYERLTNMVTQARASEAQFLEHLILRAEAIYNFQPPLPPPPRPWWKLWGKEPVPELPAIVADLRNAA